jgi:hypothetical protein
LSINVAAVASLDRLLSIEAILAGRHFFADGSSLISSMALG